MDGYYPRPLHGGHNTRAFVTIYIQSQIPPLKPTCKCKVKIPKTQDSMMASEVRSVLSRDTIEVGPGNKAFFTYPFLIPKKNGESCFVMNLKPLNLLTVCTKFKLTTFKQIRKCHPSRAMDSCTWYQVSLLPHSSSEETSLFSFLQMERWNLPVENVTLWPIHCSQDLYKCHEAHPTQMLKDVCRKMTLTWWI